VLDDFVLGSRGSTASDNGVTIALQSEGILADCGPPYIGDGACTQAVDSLDLVLANDNILESSAILQEEDCVTVSTLLLTRA